MFETLNSWWVNCMQGNVEPGISDNNPLLLHLPIFQTYFATGKENDTIELWISEWCNIMDSRNFFWDFNYEWQADRYRYEICSFQKYPKLHSHAGCPENDGSISIELTKKVASIFQDVAGVECVGFLKK